MPELPEVETTIQGIRPFLEGRILKKLVVRDRRLRWPIRPDLEELVGNRRVVNLGRRGKYILIHLDSGGMLIHLGMSGSLRVLDEKADPQKHDHFDLLCDSGHIIRYRDPRRFGALLYTDGSPSSHVRLSGLGVEPLSGDFDGAMLARAVRKRNICIKVALMDGSVVVGIGNIYASEALHLAGVHPLRKCKRISGSGYHRIAASMRQVLSKALRQGGTTLQDFRRADGLPGYFSRELLVYGRAGQPCRVCTKPIRSCIIGQRSTFYCPRCQR